MCVYSSNIMYLDDFHCSLVLLLLSCSPCTPGLKNFVKDLGIIVLD